MDVRPSVLEAVREALHEATHYPHGTAAAVFDSFDVVDIAGKTGTAEKVVDGGLEDQSWWCGYGPYDSPSWSSALIENGGHGGTAAAPAARKVFERYRRPRRPHRPGDLD